MLPAEEGELVMLQCLQHGVFSWWHQDNSRQDAIAAAIIFLAAFTMFAYLAPHSFRNVDMPVYADQILSGDFSLRTIHLGYFFLGAFVAEIPMDLDHALNLMSAAFASGTVAVIYFLAHALTQQRSVAVASVLVLLVNDAFLIEAIHAEVYMPQSFFAVASLLAWVKKRAALTGTLFAAAFLISPSSAMFVVGYPLLHRDRRAMVIAGLTASVIVIAALAPHANDFLFSPRGIFRATGDDVLYSLAILKNGRDIFFGFYAIIPFLMSGTVVALRNARLRPFALAVGLAWFFTFLLGERYMDVPVQLPVYCLFTILAGIGIVYIKEAGWIWILLSMFAPIAVFAVILFFPVPERIVDHLPSTALLVGFAVACMLAPLSLRKPTVIAAGFLLVTATAAYFRVVDTARKTDDFAIASRIAFAKAAPKTLFVGPWNDLLRFNWNARRQTYTDDLHFSDSGAAIPEALNDGREILFVQKEKSADRLTFVQIESVQAWRIQQGQ